MRLPHGSVPLGIAAAAVLSVVAIGLFMLGSPAEERVRRVDRRRVDDLRGIAAATDLYWTRHARLPVSLEELAGEPGVSIRTTDPTSAEVYGYQALDSTDYEVCASFERESGATPVHEARKVWAHGPGRQCFRFEARDVSRDEGSRGTVWLREDGGSPAPPSSDGHAQ